ncbi:hypothetical protein WS9_009185 [Paraclostridium sordellii 8483]|uniref:hypothetical protein n=1 Tax=Paraclostridium sordellii TaxID=1505 RepID=UPI0002DF862E|nr:hypothetical protein [Paeniclostridium sordellii]TAN67127.1 hypothetical protein WS9_009185 [Paeniclostridium sordellii 8483]
MKIKLGILSLLIVVGFGVVGCSNNDKKTSSETTSESVQNTEYTDTIDSTSKLKTNEDMDTTVEDKKDKKDKKDIKVEKSSDSSTPSDLTADNIKMLVRQNLAGDKLNDVNFDGENITVSVKLADPAPLTEKDVAVVRFGGISDDLLDKDGWNTLTVNFEGLGSITMNASSAVLNEYGQKCFHSEDYEGQL